MLYNCNKMAIKLYKMVCLVQLLTQLPFHRAHAELCLHALVFTSIMSCFFLGIFASVIVFGNIIAVDFRAFDNIFYYINQST